MLLKDPGSATPVTRSGELCKAKVPPGGYLLITGVYAGFATVDAYFRGEGMNEREVSLGITHTRFADGAEWNLPIEAAGRFDGDDDPELRKRIEELQVGSPLLLDPPRGGATCGK